MESPAPIFRVLASKKIVLDLRRIRWWDGRVCDKPRDDDARKEEEGAAIFAGPVTRRELELRIILETIINRFGRLRSWRQVG